MLETLTQAPPEKLYRGVIIPAHALTADMLQADMLPGSVPSTDEHGRLTVDDGNEYGVYMTDNEHMAEVAYATPRRGDALPDSPTFNWRNASQSRLETPRIGVLYEIDTKGLDVKKPFIRDSLQGVYNNGFQGDEWITDQVPATSHQVAKLHLGPDTLHESQDFEIGENPGETVEEIRKIVAGRIARLGAAAKVIEEMPGNNRHFVGAVARELSKHEGLLDTVHS